APLGHGGPPLRRRAADARALRPHAADRARGRTARDGLLARGGGAHRAEAGVRLPARLLFVGAHCDDVELMGRGLLAEGCFAGRSVGVLAFSDHRGVVDDAAAARAREEMAQNVAWLRGESGAELTDHTALLLPACRGAFEARRGELYAALESLRPRYDLVI